MISALHLIWIIPLSASFGVFCVALCKAGSTRDNITYGDSE